MLRSSEVEDFKKSGPSSYFSVNVLYVLEIGYREFIMLQIVCI